MSITGHHMGRSARIRQHTWLKVLRCEAVTAQNGRCHYCHGPITMRTATADHKWPRARNGGASRDNIVAACRECNEVKGSRSHVEFYRLIKGKMASDDPNILMIWATRRIWKRTNRACERIERAAH